MGRRETDGSIRGLDGMIYQPLHANCHPCSKRASRGLGRAGPSRRGSGELTRVPPAGLPSPASTRPQRRQPSRLTCRSLMASSSLLAPPVGTRRSSRSRTAELCEKEDGGAQPSTTTRAHPSGRVRKALQPSDGANQNAQQKSAIVSLNEKDGKDKSVAVTGSRKGKQRESNDEDGLGRRIQVCLRYVQHHPRATT